MKHGVEITDRHARLLDEQFGPGWPAPWPIGARDALIFLKAGGSDESFGKSFKCWRRARPVLNSSSKIEEIKAGFFTKLCIRRY
jgi:hypothetical protein